MTGDSIVDERAAFEALYRETCRPLLAHLRRRAPGPDAEDLLAEVYLVAWRRRDQLPAGDERRLWLYGVARRLLAAHHRTAAGSPVWPGSTQPGGPLSDGPLSDGPLPGGGFRHERADLGAGDRAAVERDEAVRAALASLPEIDRELVTLTVWDELSTASAARVVGLTPVTARVRLHRARGRLARHTRLVALVDGDRDADQIGDRRVSAGSSSAGGAPPSREAGAPGPVRTVRGGRSHGQLPSPG